KGAAHDVVVGEEQIDAFALEQFDQLFQARYLLRHRDAACFQPGQAVAAQNAADAQFAFPYGFVEDMRIQGVPVPFLHQQGSGKLRIAVDLGVWCGAEETIGNASADVLSGSAERGELDLVWLLQSAEDALEYSDRSAAEFAIDDHPVRGFEAGIETYDRVVVFAAGLLGQHADDQGQAKKQMACWHGVIWRAVLLISVYARGVGMH